jgi:type VI secretion system FHA domain protein
MGLLIEVVSTEKHLMGDNAQHLFYPAGGVIGRAPECDWVIPDQTRHMSGRHAIISYEAGQFFITDISTNGIYLNGVEALERNRATALSDSDRLLMGQIHFQVQVNLEAASASPQSQLPAESPLPKPPAPARSPMAQEADPMAKVDQWVAQQPQPPAQAEPVPDDLAPEREPFQPPKPVVESSAQSEPQSLSELPENWWQEPVADGVEEEDVLPGKSSIPPLPDWDDEDMHTAITPLTESRKEDREAAIRAFAEGLGVSSSELSEAGGVEFLRKAGMLLRVCMRGMVVASQARSSMKNEFRLDMTLVNMKDNNPIKLSANAEQAIKHMLAEDWGSFLPMDQALQECFDDFQEHQLAVMAGMQGAFVELMETLSPQELEKRFERNRSGGLNLGSKNARYWEAYRELHQDLLAEDDIFTSLFSEPFARAYDQQVATLKSAKKHKRK